MIDGFIVKGDAITTDCEPRVRGYRDYLIIHHTATTSESGALAIMQPNDGRTVSANWVLGRDGKYWRVVPEYLRAWTSASWLDDIATTVEVVNQTGSPTWGISEDQRIALAYLAVRLFREGLLQELSRRYIIGHNEVSTYAPGTSYATSCPGPDMLLDHIVELAKHIYAGGSPASAPKLEVDMPFLLRNDTAPSASNPYGGEIGVISGARYEPVATIDEVNAIALIVGPAPHGGVWTGLGQHLWEALIQRFTGHSRQYWDTDPEQPKLVLTDEQVAAIAGQIDLPTTINLSGKLS